MYTKTLSKALFVLGFVSLPLSGGCVGGGNPFDTDPSGDADTDADADADTDTDVDVFEATVPIVYSEDIGDVIGIEVDGDLDPSATCDASSHTCWFTATEPGDYEVTLESSTMLCRNKPVVVTADGEQASISFAAGTGCADSTWDPLGDQPCADWTPGDCGWYKDVSCENENNEDHDVRTHLEDLDDDDVDEVVIDTDWGSPFPMSGRAFQKKISDGEYVHGVILEDGDVTYHYTREDAVDFVAFLDCP